MWVVLKIFPKTCLFNIKNHISLWKDSKFIIEFIEVFNFIKGIDDMFNFFSDVKNRLTAIEAEIKAIYAHLRDNNHPNVSGVAETVSAQPVTSETPATKSTENGSAN